MIIDIADRVVFANKMFAITAILGLVGVCASEATVALADGGFRALRRMVALADEAQLARLLACLAAFLRMGAQFVAMAAEEELAAALIAVDGPGGGRRS
jgi:hypothetical protein